MTYGRVSAAVYEAARKAADSVRIIRLKRVYPVPEEIFDKELDGIRAILFVEEGIKSGGVGEKFAAAVSGRGIAVPVKIRALEEFVPNGSLSDLLDKYGFTAEKLADEIAGCTEARDE